MAADAPDPEVPRDTASLEGGGAMPLLGYGTWRLSGPDAVRATGQALEAGYRHVDTATMYRNEREVGQAVAESGLRRDDVFVTTKCPPDRSGRELETLQRSLDALGLDHVDLWLIHAPAGNSTKRMWEAFVDARSQGLARDIGVSNFDAADLDAVTEATGVRPAVNQIEWSPLLYDVAVAEQHRDRSVVLEGYSALKRGVLDNPTVTAVAQRLGRTPAQVVVRWHLDHGVVVIPKSADAGRLRANADVGGWSLSPEDLTALDRLGKTRR